MEIVKPFVHQQTHNRLERFEATLQAVLLAPEDAEALHALRVAIRRLQQCLRLFRDFYDATKLARVRRKLKRLMDHCGDVRNFDVAIALLGSEVEVAELASEREQRAQALVLQLDRWRGERRPEKWRKRLKVRRPKQGMWDVAATPALNARLVLPPQAEQLFASGQEAVAPSAEDHDLHALHQFRLRGKRFRYSLELFEDAYPDAAVKMLQLMRQLQDHLGAINDCVSSRHLLDSRQTQAIAVIDRIEAQRLQAFHAFWPEFAAQQPIWKEALSGQANNDGILPVAPRRGRTPQSDSPRRRPSTH
jgi:CHAD domain-containing protein